MATTIKTSDGKLHTLALTTKGGMDFLADVMGNSGVKPSEDEGAEFELSVEDYRWWKTWAANEQLINDTIAERNLEGEVPNFYDCGDWEDAQEQYAEYLGIEIEEF